MFQHHVSICFNIVNLRTRLKEVDFTSRLPSPRLFPAREVTGNLFLSLLWEKGVEDEGMKIVKNYLMNPW
ncbi:hypothetical protein OsccyDRAFT_4869 [Leptolyngbyaceae cyanobacterium JSC-12]|nr:hypothetical protein OsccyDRAFT_4869 [Leptolyngbyaceae cyanobacterium JSC-12]